MVIARRHSVAAAGAALYCVGLLATLSHAAGHVSVPFRMAGLVLLGWGAWRQRSLTVWIFWSMLAGGELGADAPAFAVSLRVFSDIFLRLIKTIVAPLILGTLITGIAAHGQMRSLGRMGLKALVYFEVLTTIAMLVGLAAINITHAGVGLDVPQQHAAANVPRPAQAAPMRWPSLCFCHPSLNLLPSRQVGKLRGASRFSARCLANTKIGFVWRKL